MPKEVSIYVASPLGFSECGRDFLYAKVIPPIQELGYTVLDPWKLTPKGVIDSAQNLPYSQRRFERWQKVDDVIGQNNITAMLRCTGAVAVLDGVDVDSGTAAEIGFISGQNKSILGYRNDFRLASENEGSPVNLQVKKFIYRTPGGKIISEISDLKSELKAIFG
jgi:nucleoside 2-deoxyribosyltransferase